MNQMRLLPLFASLSVALAGPASAQVKPANGSLRLHFAQGADWRPLAYETAKGDILFQAVVNDHPATVLLDNGTEKTVIDTGFATRAGIALGDASGAALVGANARLAARSTAALTMTAAHAFSIAGPLVAINLQPMSMALGLHVDAVLGSDMLDNFAIMIQPDQRKLSLAPSGSITVGTGATVVPMNDDHAIAVDIDGNRLDLNLDLGFNGAIRLTDAAWRKVFPSDPFQAGRSQTGADGVTRSTRFARADVEVGRIAARNVPVDSGYVTTGGAQGSVGNALLARATIVIDAKKRELILIPRSGATG
jgi:hypothetical protein